MTKKSDDDWKTRAAVAAGSAIGSAAIAAALMWVKKRKGKDGQPPATSTAPHQPPPETD